MKILEAKVIDKRKEDPESEPDHRTDSWIIEAKLETDLLDWEARESTYELLTSEPRLSKPAW
jgi:hypothetical protein